MLVVIVLGPMDTLSPLISNRAPFLPLLKRLSHLFIVYLYLSLILMKPTGQMYIYRPRGLVESESQTQAVTAADSQDMSNRDKHYPHYASSLHLSNSYEYILKLTRCQRQSIQTNVFNVSLSIVQSVAQNSFLHLVVIFSVVVAEMDFRSWMVEMAWAARPLTSFIHTQAAPESASLFHLHDKVYKALKASANSNNHFHSSKNHLHFKIYKALKPSATTNWLKMPLIKI